MSNEVLKTVMIQLAAPFPVNRLSWRVGSTNAKQLNCKPWEATKGIALAYVDARDVMMRLDAIQDQFGVLWQNEYLPPSGKVVVCRIGLMIGGSWVWRSNGAGDTEYEAEKGACSNAFKRAAVLWGIGRYLYSLPSPWVDLDRGRLPKGFAPELPAWATPEGYLEIMQKRKKQ